MAGKERQQMVKQFVVGLALYGLLILALFKKLPEPDRSEVAIRQKPAPADAMPPRPVQKSQNFENRLSLRITDSD